MNPGLCHGRALSYVLLAALLLSAGACTGALPPPAQIDSAGGPELQVIEASLRERIARGDRDPEVLASLSRVLLRRNKAEEAEPWALEATQRAPFRSDFLRNLGDIHWTRGERFRAALAFAQAVRVDPQDLEGYLWLGRARAALGEAIPAQTALRQAILLESDYYEARLELARILLESRLVAPAEPASASTKGAADSREPPLAGNAHVGYPLAPAMDPLAAAAEQIGEARRIRPDALEAALLHVRILKAQGFLADALYAAEQGLRLDGASSTILRELLDIHRQSKHWPEVAATLERLRSAGELSPLDETARADYLEGTGDLDGASALRVDLLRRHPQDAAVLIAAARGLLARNQPREALRAAESATVAAPKLAAAHYWKAVAHFLLEEDLEGDLSLNRAEALDGGHAAVRLLRIRRMLSERNLAGAAPGLKAFLGEFPTDLAGRILQAEWATLSGDYAEAEKHLAQLPRDDAAVRFAWGRLDYLRGRFASVIDDLAPLTTQPSAPWEAVYLEAAALGRLGRVPEAQEKVRPFLEKDLGGPAFHRLAGMLAHQAGDARAAERFYQQGLRRSPRDGALLEGISRIAVEREAWREARLPLEAGIEHPGPFQAIMLERLALVYRKLGETDRAKAMLARYLDAIDPLVRESREPADTAILYRLTLPTMNLAIQPK